MFTMNLSQKSRMIVLVIAILAVGFTVLFGGSTATVMAAESAIPGDALYGVKTQFERTRISLAGSALVRAELQLQFAERRLEETKSLIEEGRFQNLKSTTVLFETHINNALSELGAIAASDPEAAAGLLNRITEMLMRYTDLLDTMLQDIPEPVQAEVVEAINALQQMSGDDNSNVNANENANENVNANLNENSNDNLNDNLNENSNDALNENDDAVNENDNLNDNLNENENDDDINENSNDNDDDSINENSNDNDDDSANENDNENVNDNTNDNSNDDDDNDNDHDNDNDNDDDDDNDNGDDDNDNYNDNDGYDD